MVVDVVKLLKDKYIYKMAVGVVEFLKEKNILVIGGTGFLGKGILMLFLSMFSRGIGICNIFLSLVFI